MFVGGVSRVGRGGGGTAPFWFFMFLNREISQYFLRDVASDDSEKILQVFFGFTFYEQMNVIRNNSFFVNPDLKAALGFLQDSLDEGAVPG